MNKKNSVGSNEDTILSKCITSLEAWAKSIAKKFTSENK